MSTYSPQESQHETGYFCEMYGSTDDSSNKFRICKHDNTGLVVLDEVDFPWTADTWYYMRMRADEDIIKAKIWDSNDIEPEDWTITVQDNEHKRGIIGIGNFNKEGDKFYDFVSVGWLGNKAKGGS
ncbi:MAG: hypothetical protein ACOC2W_02310 [bacterium]